jgi:RNA polymerase sigma factor (sigma-70 family)
MSTIRPFAPVAISTVLPANSRTEARAITRWDGDIVRAAKASARRRGLASDHPAAEDAAQEARLSLALVVRQGIHAERYVRRVISNSVRNAARQTLVVSNETSADALDALPDDAGREGDLLAESRVREWIARQPAQVQAVFHLLYREDLSQREAAERLGVSQPRVAKLHRELLARGRDELRSLAS